MFKLVEFVCFQISSGGAAKRGVYLQGGIHAREWISPAVVMYMTEQVCNFYIQILGQLQESNCASRVVELISPQNYQKGK